MVAGVAPVQPDEVVAQVQALSADLRAVREQITAEVAALEKAWPGERVHSRLARLRELEGTLDGLIADADNAVTRMTPEAVATAYELGGYATAIRASATASFTGVDLDAAAHLASDTMGELLDATRFMSSAAKAFIREAARDATRSSLITGITATQGGKVLADALAARGLTGVVYRNGANVGLDTYAEMVLRTKTAVAYQEGGFNQGDTLGVDWWEVMDGQDCGWTAHYDPDKADGKIVSLEEARAYPIAHPNCVRVTSPRPDILTAADAAKAEPTERYDQDIDAAAAAARKKAPGAVDFAREVENHMLEGGFDGKTSGPALPDKASAAEARNAARTAGGPRLTLGPDTTDADVVSEGGAFPSLTRESLTPAQNAALQDYLGVAYQQINGVLRWGENEYKLRNREHRLTQAEDVSSALRPTTSPTVVRRIITDDSAEEVLERFGGTPRGGNVEPAYFVGRSYDERGFTSSAYVKEGRFGTFTNLGHEVRMLIELPEGTRVGNVSGIERSRGEQEILIDKGQRYTVVNAWKDRYDGATVLHLLAEALD